MMDVNDIIDKTFGELKVFTYSGQEKRGEKYSYHYYNCVCSCGKRKKVGRLALLNGSSKSCGHLRRKKPPEQIEVSDGKASQIKNRPIKTNEIDYKRMAAECLTLAYLDIERHNSRMTFNNTRQGVLQKRIDVEKDPKAMLKWTKYLRTVKSEAKTHILKAAYAEDWFRKESERVWGFLWCLSVCNLSINIYKKGFMEATK